MECLRPAKLADAPVKEIRDLEKKLGVTLIAYDKFHPYRKLKAADLAKIQAAEKETGSILLAYEA